MWRPLTVHTGVYSLMIVFSPWNGWPQDPRGFAFQSTLTRDSRLVPQLAESHFQVFLVCSVTPVWLLLIAVQRLCTDRHFKRILKLPPSNSKTWPTNRSMIRTYPSLQACIGRKWRQHDERSASKHPETVFSCTSYMYFSDHCSL